MADGDDPDFDCRLFWAEANNECQKTIHLDKQYNERIQKIIKAMKRGPLYLVDIKIETKLTSSQILKSMRSFPKFGYSVIKQKGSDGWHTYELIPFIGSDSSYNREVSRNR